MLESGLLFLVGFRACGKTSVAEAIARQCDVPWLDMDVEIATAANQTIADIFATGGEDAFRDLETEHLSIVAAGPPQVVSLGGGAVLRPENRWLIKESGDCVWLKANVETIVQRLRKDSATETQRPPLTDLSMVKEVETLLAERSPIYRQVADYQIETDQRSLHEIVTEIVAWANATA